MSISNNSSTWYEETMMKFGYRPYEPDVSQTTQDPTQLVKAAQQAAAEERCCILRSQLANMNKQFAKMQSDFARIQTEGRLQKEKIEVLTTQNGDLQKQADLLKNELQANNQELMLIRQQKEDLRSELTTANQEKAQQKCTIEELKDTIASLGEAIDILSEGVPSY